MSEFQITIIPVNSTGAMGTDPSTPFNVTQHKRGDTVVESIEELEDVWNQVIAKLTNLAEKSDVTTSTSKYEMSEIEFNLAVEAGISVGLVTKANASVSITFIRNSNATEGNNDKANI